MKTPDYPTNPNLRTSGGVPVTEQMITDLAAKAEAGYDLRHLIPRRRGMRWRTGPGGRVVLIHRGIQSDRQDPVIGMLDTPILAQLAVDAVNLTLQAAEIGAPPLRAPTAPAATTVLTARLSELQAERELGRLEMLVLVALAQTNLARVLLNQVLATWTDTALAVSIAVAEVQQRFQLPDVLLLQLLLEQQQRLMDDILEGET